MHANPTHIFSGIWLPLITPFCDGEVDYDAVADLARHYIGCGISGFVVCGTTGEGPSLETFEKARVIDIVSSLCPADIPVVLGLEGANTAKLVAEIKSLGDRPLAGYLLPAPSYVRPAPEGIFAHFMRIADAVRRPIVIYDIPARTGVALPLDLVTRLYESGACPAIKACGLSHHRLNELTSIDGLNVMCGDDAWMYSTLDAGGTGAIMTSAHLVPNPVVEVYRAFEKGDRDEALARFRDLLPLIRMIFEEPNPGPVKAGLADLGLIHDELRLPMTSAAASLRVKIKATCRSLLDMAHGHLARASISCPSRTVCFGE